MAKASKSARTGVWVAVIIIIAILAAYGGYYSGLEEGLKRARQGPQEGQGAGPTLPSSIKVGVIASGVLHAPDVLYGVQLARDLLNNKSDVVSRNVALSIKRLDREDPREVEDFATSLMNEGVRVIIGVLSNSEAKAVLRTLRQSDAILVLVSSEVYDDEVYDEPRLVKLLGGPDVEARAMVDLALEVGGEGLRAAVIAVNDSYCRRLSKAIVEGLRSRGVQVVSEVVYDPREINTTEDLIDLNRSSPAIVFLAGRGGDAYKTLEAARDVGLRTTWILSSALVDGLLNRSDLVPYLAGSYLVARRSATLSPHFKSFAELYRMVYHGEPHEMAVYGFDALVLAALGTAYAGKYNGSAIRESTDLLCSFMGVTWPKFLDSKGNAVQEHAILKVVKAEEGYGLEVVGYWVPTGVERAFIEWLEKLR